MTRFLCIFTVVLLLAGCSSAPLSGAAGEATDKSRPDDPAPAVMYDLDGNVIEDGSVASAEGETEAVFNLKDYRDTVSACNDLIMDEAVLLSNMGRYEYSYWSNLTKLGGTVDYEKISSKALEWLAEESDVDSGIVQENYTAICGQYRDIINTPISGIEADNIYKNFSELFDSFNRLYLLVTDPSGDINTFYESYNHHVENIKNSSSILEALLG